MNNIITILEDKENHKIKIAVNNKVELECNYEELSIENFVNIFKILGTTVVQGEYKSKLEENYNDK